ncbi:MAG: hypothetical protein BWY92_00698 [Firmicutes bacterium ADurb.BinA052]|jgi:hypothetical protein|nr:MAG: hypothetical protein BWY92_00698 [Firmicutes bacterium ADurb.BinA052]
MKNRDGEEKGASHYAIKDRRETREEGTEKRQILLGIWSVRENQMIDGKTRT